MEPIPLRFPLLFDGATGTALQALGMPLGVCTEDWALTHKDALDTVQKGYVSAGAQVLTTPTLGANRGALAHFGLGDQVETMNRTLAQWTRENAGADVLVAGCLGSTGLLIPPYGETPFEELVGIYGEQAMALTRGGVDLFLVEGVTSMAMARAAVLGIRESGSDLPIFVTCFCDEEGRTPEEMDVLACGIVMQGMGVAAFGLGCIDIDVSLAQLERLREHIDLPLIVQPSAGLPMTVDGAICYDDNPQRFAVACPHWAAAGVEVFGTCCGTHPGHITALKEAISHMDTLSLPPRHDPDVIPCASEKEARFITPDVDWGDPIPCTSVLLETILEAEEMRPYGALQIEIMNQDDLWMFAQEQYAIRDPLCIWADVPELMEGALRAYQGRAIYDSTAELDEDVVEKFAKTYGLIVL